MTRWNFHRALMAIWELINHANKYIDGMEPWRLAKDPAQRERLSTIMRHLLEVNRIVAVLLSPVMPTTSEKVLERLGIPRRAHELRLDVDTRWGTLVEGKPVVKGEALFPRIDAHRAGAGDEPPGKTREAGAAGPAAPAAGGQRDEAPPAAAAAIPMEAFKKVDLRVGVVRHAEKIPNSDKLLRLLVDVGEERPVVAGIARTHTPEDLVGKQVVVVANLEPIRLMGVESRGMVLAVRDAKGLALLTTERPVVPGLPVS
jgi:methionyl-tRNA synthetase